MHYGHVLKYTLSSGTLFHGYPTLVLKVLSFYFGKISNKVGKKKSNIDAEQRMIEMDEAKGKGN